MGVLNRNKLSVPTPLFKGLLLIPSPQIRKELGLFTFADCEGYLIITANCC